MSMPEPAWSLHPQLAHDTVPVGDLALARVLAMSDANYPWVILVPRRAGAVEIIDLDEADRGRLMAEIAEVSAALKRLTGCDKLNVAAIGNMVPQLHVHIVACGLAEAGLGCGAGPAVCGRRIGRLRCRYAPRPEDRVTAPIELI